MRCWTALIYHAGRDSVLIRLFIHLFIATAHRIVDDSTHSCLVISHVRRGACACVCERCHTERLINAIDKFGSEFRWMRVECATGLESIGQSNGATETNRTSFGSECTARTNVSHFSRVRICENENDEHIHSGCRAIPTDHRAG